MLATASAPLYLAWRLGWRNSRLFVVSISFAMFALVHGGYHLAEFLDYDELADMFLLPASVLLLVLFGLLQRRILGS